MNDGGWKNILVNEGDWSWVGHYFGWLRAGGKIFRVGGGGCTV